MNSVIFPRLLAFGFLVMLWSGAAWSAPDCNDPKHQDKPACADGGGDGSGGADQVTCDSAYYGMSMEPLDPPTFCTKLGHSDQHCWLDVPTDGTPGLAMSEHCQIVKTLVLPEPLRILSGRGMYAMYLGDEHGNWWGGEAGFSNDTGEQGASARIADMTIVGRAGVVTGCGGNRVSTAVRLNPDLDRPNDEGPGGPRMAAANLIIDTDDTVPPTRFCNAVEYVGSDGDIAVPYFAGSVSRVTVMPEAYANYAILLKKLNSTDNVTGDYDVAGVGDNTVHYSSVGNAAIMLEDVERALVTDNTVAAPANGVGIQIVRSGTEDADVGLMYLQSRPVNLERNDVDITNGVAGFVIDHSRIDHNRGNTVVGDGGGWSYQWLDRQTSDDGTETLEFPTKGQRVNTCNGNLIEAAGEEC